MPPEAGEQLEPELPEVEVAQSALLSSAIAARDGVAPNANARSMSEDPRMGAV